MNSSNIVAIPSHPPLPRGVSGMFHPVDLPPYSAFREAKTPGAAYDYDAERRPNNYLHPEQYPPQYSHPHPYPQQRPAQPPQPKAPLRAGSNIYMNALNRPRSNSGVLAFPTSSHRRNTTASLDPRDDSRLAPRRSPSSGLPSEVPLSSTYRHSRHGSVLSDNSGESIGDKMVGYSSDRKYVCDWRNCGQSFDRIEHLNRHKRRHTGEKPYRCLVGRCSKLFSRFDNMMQHVGIHTFEGVKTEIPNIKNLSEKGRGRGRARRTSYRSTQDSQEKFRRHVEGTLGSRLAHSCILPADTPDFSNLTLRPLLNDCGGQGDQCADDHQDVPQGAMSPGYGSPETKRQRCDSVIGGVDSHLAAYAPTMAATKGGVS
ncbi:hypothetical protein LPJ61_003910 [Coemansia biformis]|uniref:C2H2-type domain-containing protein n=1 Tax=Coemansia biformis TaxID=1286918 RepID=A0A9W8CX95_9FUNG|nr:hypothetical protein LPJ61_003910 [Coemansia biformis]